MMRRRANLNEHCNGKGYRRFADNRANRRVCVVSVWGFWLAWVGACSAPSAENTELSPRNPASSRAGGPNVLLITIDTLRADALRLYSQRGVATPTIETIAEQGILFEHTNAHAPITLPSHTSILTGLYPPKHGVRNNGTFYADSELQTLAETLGAAGYRTGAFVSAFVLDHRFGLDQGFDRYDDDLEDGRQEWSTFGVKDRIASNTVSRSIRWLNENTDDERPFFAWVHLYDPHYPYAPPSPFAEAYPGKPYLGEIAFVDHALASLVAALERRGEWQNTLVVLTADHGESFGQHGESTHSMFVYEATQHVPLIIRPPADYRGSLTRGSRIGGLARHIDLVPTILARVGISSDALPGRNLFEAATPGDLPDNVVSYAEAYLPHDQFGWAPLFAVRDLSSKFIDAPKPELYALDEDPSELDNLLDERPELLGRLQAQLKALRESFPSDVRQQRAMDAETEAQLEALGYVQPGPKSDAAKNRDPKDMIASHEQHERANRLVDARRYREAVMVYRALLETDPANPSLHLQIAGALAEMGSFDAAEREYEAARAIAPEHASAYSGLAKIAFKGHGDFARARELIDAAIERSPNDPGLYGVLGDLLHEQGKFDAALDAYRRAFEGGDRTASYLLGFASALNRTGELAEARRMIERTIRIDRRNPVAHYNHGVILNNLQLPAIALGAFEEALRLDATLVPARLAAGRLMRDQGRPNAALALLSGSDLDDEIAVQELRGEVLVTMNELPRAIKAFRRVVRAQPENLRAQSNLASLLQRTGQADSAYTTFESVVKASDSRSPLRCDALLQMARIGAARERLDDAQARLGDALRCGGDLIALRVRGDPVLQRFMVAFTRQMDVTAP